MSATKNHLLAISVLLTFVPVASAEPVLDRCSGVLHWTNGQLMFGGARGEGEGICIVTNAEVEKVLRTCRVGRHCTVKVKVDYCKDSGECAEIMDITSVRESR